MTTESLIELRNAFRVGGGWSDSACEEMRETVESNLIRIAERTLELLKPSEISAPDIDRVAIALCSWLHGRKREQASNETWLSLPGWAHIVGAGLGFLGSKRGIADLRFFVWICRLAKLLNSNSPFDQERQESPEIFFLVLCLFGVGKSHLVNVPSIGSQSEV
jgi:hypothetical protein